MVNILEKVFEHNHWANLEIIQACSTLTDAQLDAPPGSATKGSIRRTLTHLVSSQQGYMSLLTGIKPRFELDDRPTFTRLREAVTISGEALLGLAKGEPTKSRLQTDDGYYVEPWVVMVQVINHAGEHREQICSMLTALGVTPPDLDGWSYGEATKALVPVTS